MSSLSDAYFIPINKLVRALWGREGLWFYAQKSRKTSYNSKRVGSYQVIGCEAFRTLNLSFRTVDMKRLGGVKIY